MTADFRFRASPRSERLSATPSYLYDGWFISEMQLDGQDVMGSGFSSRPAWKSVLEVTISNARGVITGIIRDRQDEPLTTCGFSLHQGEYAQGCASRQSSCATLPKCFRGLHEVNR